ncbi:hypothetical protein JCM10213_006672 [Rhodosporidiobolus nylandii]
MDPIRQSPRIPVVQVRKSQAIAAVAADAALAAKNKMMKVTSTLKRRSGAGTLRSFSAGTANRKSKKTKKSESKKGRVPLRAYRIHPRYNVSREWATHKSQIGPLVGHEYVRDARRSGIFTTVFYTMGDDEQVRRVHPSNVDRFTPGAIASYGRANKGTEPKKKVDVAALRAFVDPRFHDIDDGVGFFRVDLMQDFVV